MVMMAVMAVEHSPLNSPQLGIQTHCAVTAKLFGDTYIKAGPFRSQGEGNWVYAAVKCEIVFVFIKGE